MMKGLIFGVLFLLSACQGGFWGENMRGEMCPVVQIMRDNAYLTQFVNYKETFQINIDGYEGYCYYDREAGRYRALIAPIFKVKRLAPSDETEVRFSYYTETVKGAPEYLGKKTYYITVPIKIEERETYYKAPAAKVFIPSEKGYDYDINLGLWLSPEEAHYNHRTFDINYRYMENK